MFLLSLQGTCGLIRFWIESSFCSIALGTTRGRRLQNQIKMEIACNPSSKSHCTVTYELLIRSLN